MARSRVSLSAGQRQHPPLLAAFALALLTTCSPPALTANPADEPLSPAAHIAHNQQKIADATRLNLTPAQVGGLWAQIAWDYFDLVEFNKAEDAYNHALRLLEPIASSRMAYAVTLANLGSIYTLTHRFDAALNCHKHSLAVLQELGDALMIARAQGHLAEVYIAMGKGKEAARYTLPAADAVRRLPAATSEDRGSILISHAYALCLSSHCEEGMRTAREAMQIVLANFNAQSLPAGQAQIALGYTEVKTGATAAAEEHLREGVRVLRLQLPPSHPVLTHALSIYHDALAKNHHDVEARQIAEEQRTVLEQNRTCSNCTVSVNGLHQ